MVGQSPCRFCGGDFWTHVHNPCAQALAENEARSDGSTTRAAPGSTPAAAATPATPGSSSTVRTIAETHAADERAAAASTPAPRPGVDAVKRSRLERLAEPAGRMFDVMDRLVRYRIDVLHNTQRERERYRIPPMRREWIEAVVDFARVALVIVREGRERGKSRRR